LRAAYGTALQSIVLYGSRRLASISQRSDYNVLVIVDGFDPARLARHRRHARLGGRGNPAPLTMTMSEWRDRRIFFR
jgi:hypothetical protein